MKSNKTPQWVKNLDLNDPNRELLEQLVLAGKKPLEAPRTIVFVLRGRMENKDLLNTIQINGWTIDTGFDNGFWIEAKKDLYVITQKDLIHDETTFITLAKLYGWDYDGWLASVC